MNPNQLVANLRPLYEVYDRGGEEESRGVDRGGRPVKQSVDGAKTPHGKKRPEYRANPESNRDPMTDEELAANRGRRGAKLYRKAREGKL